MALFFEHRFLRWVVIFLKSLNSLDHLASFRNFEPRDDIAMALFLHFPILNVAQRLLRSRDGATGPAIIPSNKDERFGGKRAGACRQVDRKIEGSGRDARPPHQIKDDRLKSVLLQKGIDRLAECLLLLVRQHVARLRDHLLLRTVDAAGELLRIERGNQLVRCAPQNERR
jgi:hypothetical protein